MAWRQVWGESRRPPAPLHEKTVREALDQKTETNQGSQDSHNPLFAKAKPCGIETVAGSGRSGHLAKGGHVASGLRVCCFGVTSLVQMYDNSI